MRKIDIQLYSRLTNRRERRRLRTLRNQRKSTSSNSSDYDEITKIKIPDTLDFLKNQDKTIKLLNNIQNTILGNKKFSIDHRSMKKISKESLLLLVAEIERCSTLSSVKLKPNYRLFPKNIQIQQLLKEIGYWKYFNMRPKKSKNILNNRLYLKIASDKTVSGVKIGELIEFFETILYFNPETRDKFSDALIEASANSVEHAYSSKNKKCIDKWWLTASLNKISNEVSFVFYDQGDGILNTLEKSNKSIKFKRLIDQWINIDKYSKKHILKKLITTNLSQYKDNRRGNGLISFKSFIDEVEDGELSISTDNFTYLAKEDKVVEYTNKLNGTLIVWKIKATSDKNKKIYVKENKNE